MARTTFGDALKAAEAANPTASNNAPDPGTYTATVVSGNVQPTKDGQNYRLGLRFQVDSGPMVNRSAWNSQMLRPEDDTNIRIVTRMCEALGIDAAKELSEFDLGDPTDAPEARAELIRVVLEYIREKAQGARVEVKVETRNDRTEVKFVNPLKKDAAPSQLNAAKAGAAAVASAMGKPAAPKKPRAAI